MPTITYGAYAQTDVITVNDSSQPNAFAPHVARLADGGFIVVYGSIYSDGVTNTVNGPIRARVFDANGVPLTDEIVISTLDTGIEQQPRVAVAADGQIAIAFLSSNGATSTVRVQFLSSSFVPTGPDIEVPFTGVGPFGVNAPALDISARGEDFIVTVAGATQGVHRIQIDGDTYAASEQASWSTPRNAQTVQVHTSSGESVTVAVDSSGNTSRLLTWSTGTATAEATADDVGNLNDSPAIVALANGAYAIAYRDTQHSGTGGDISLRIFNADETARSGVILVNDGATTGAQFAPTITALANGMIAVFWQNSGSGSGAIGASFFDQNGQPLLLNIAIDTGSVQMPSATTLADGSIALVWGNAADGTIETRILDFVREVLGDATAETFDGDALRDAVLGMGGNDVLRTFGGDDAIDGGDGDDTLEGGAGNDLLIGGAGDDYIDGGTGSDLIDGGDGNDEIYANWNLTVGLFDPAAGSHEILGGAGDDWIYGDNGDDLIEGEDGDDQLHGYGGSDTIYGGDGNDVIGGWADNDILYGGAGNDQLAGLEGSDILYGGDGDDTLEGDIYRNSANTSNDILYGEAGDDSLRGDFGNDILNGGPGDDRIEGGDGFDMADYSDAPSRVVVALNIPSDYIGEGTRQDTLGAGRDFLWEIEGIIGSEFDDELIAREYATGVADENGMRTVLRGGGGNDVLRGLNLADRLDGGTGDDMLLGGGDNDVMYGEEGDDFLWGGDGDDVMDGGAGFDTATYVDATSGVRVDLRTVAIQNTLAAGADRLVGIEGIVGSAFGDVLTGNGENNVFEGGFGNDVLEGGDGADVAEFDVAVGAAAVVRYQNIHAVVSGTLGVDRINSIETLRFNGVDYATSSFEEFRAIDYVAGYNDLILAYGVGNLPQAVEHYLAFGFAEGRNSVQFNGWQYLAGYDDLITAFGPDLNRAASHFIQHGLSGGRERDNFNGADYIASYNDLILAFGLDEDLAARHYVQHGLSGGRERDAFDGWQYIASYDDLIINLGADEAAAARQFVRNGFGEGRSRDLYDWLEYIAGYDDLIAAYGADETAGARHFVESGFAGGRQRDAFDGLQYIASYGDLIENFGEDEGRGASHYIQFGYTEGRSRDTFDAAQYVANYADLQAAYGSDLYNATRHYILFGYAEGRTDEDITPNGGDDALAVLADKGESFFVSPVEFDTVAFDKGDQGPAVLPGDMDFGALRLAVDDGFLIHGMGETPADLRAKGIVMPPEWAVLWA